MHTINTPEQIRLENIKDTEYTMLCLLGMKSRDDGWNLKFVNEYAQKYRLENGVDIIWNENTIATLLSYYHKLEREL